MVLVTTGCKRAPQIEKELTSSISEELLVVCSRSDEPIEGEEELFGKGMEDGKQRTPGELRKLDLLVGAYRAMAGDSAQVVINADPDVNTGRVMALLNIFAKHGITQVSFEE